MTAPGQRPRDGRWAPGTLVKTPTGHLGQVLPYDTDLPDPPCGDSVFVHLLAQPERPWQRWSSRDLTAIPPTSQ